MSTVTTLYNYRTWMTAIALAAVVSVASCRVDTVEPTRTAVEPVKPLAHPSAATVIYTQNRRGYYGTEAIWIAQHVPDHGINRDDLIIGWVHDEANEELRGLVKFTNLDIPAGAKIVNAELSFRCNSAHRQPQVVVYGLLKGFTTPAGEWSAAQVGETTWNSQHHGQQRWAMPGADGGSDGFVFDGDADRCGHPDDTVTIDSPGRVRFDVTRSLAKQFAAGKLYGWVLKAPKVRVDSHAVFSKKLIRLTVSYIPPAGAAQRPASPPEPHLISFDLAYAAEIAANPARAGELPFEGCTFWGIPNGDGQRWLCNSVMGPDPIQLADYSEFISHARIAGRPPSPLQHNFLRVNLTVPGTLIKKDKPYTWGMRPRGNDKVTMWWADGFETVVHNFKVAAQVAKQAGMKGLFIDLEPYGGNVWSFDQQQDAQDLGKTHDQTRAQVKRRAEQIFKAVNEVYPDMTIIVIFYLYTEQEYLLWNDFCDGMFAAADSRMRIVNGNERAYQVVSRKEFEALYDWHYKGSLQYCSVPKKYLRQSEAGFGVWFDWQGWGEQPELISSSAVWQTKLENALAVADSYVWVYTGSSGRIVPRWWTGEHLPAEYMAATKRAVELARQRRALD